MPFTLSMHLPERLRHCQEDLAIALTTPLPANWDPDRTYEHAYQPAAIAALLIDTVHEHLSGASIGYLFREKMKTRDRTVWGRASKAGAKLEFFADHDFIVEFNWTQWRHLSPMQRVALVDHELSHLGREEDDKGNRSWVLVSHDIEEFRGIVERWGLWRPDLVVFSGAVVHAHQLGLFDGSVD
jgi:hypothetical protein